MNRQMKIIFALMMIICLGTYSANAQSERKHIRQSVKEYKEGNFSSPTFYNNYIRILRIHIVF